MPKMNELFDNEIARDVAIGVGVATAGAFHPRPRFVPRHGAWTSGVPCFERSRELVAEAGEVSKLCSRK